MTEAGTILIAVRDGVLADSLRFSLEIEGFDTRFCDEHSLCPLMRAPCHRTACLVLDQDVFSCIVDEGETALFCDRTTPVILMASDTTGRVLARARSGGITVLEKPILGGVLFDTIRQAIEGNVLSAPPARPS